MTRLPFRTHFSAAAVLLAVGVGSSWWSIATGRITVGTLTIRALAVFGLIAIAEWVVDLARAIRRHRRP